MTTTDYHEETGFTRPPSTVSRALKTGTAKPIGWDNRAQVSGTVAVKLDTYQQEEICAADESGIALQRYGMHEEFRGGIVGTGVASHLRVTRKLGHNTFTGIERVTGTLAGRAGSFVITDAGYYDEHNIVHGRWTAVAGSGTEELKGLRAQGEFTVAIDAPGGPLSTYTLEYWFADEEEDIP